MSRQTGEQSLGVLITKPAGNRSGGQDRTHPKARHQPRMVGKCGDWTQHIRSKFTPALNKRLYQLSPDFAVHPKGSLSVRKITFQNQGRAVVERVSQWGRRVNPLQA